MRRRSTWAWLLCVAALLVSGVALGEKVKGDGDEAPAKGSDAEGGKGKGSGGDADKDDGARKPKRRADSDVEARDQGKVEGEADSADEVPPHDKTKYTVDINLEQLSKLDLPGGTVAAELVVGVHCDREPCAPELAIVNGKETAKPEKLKDDKLFKKYKIKAEIDVYLDFARFPYDAHEVPILLYERHDPYQVQLVKGAEVVDPRVRLPGWDLGDVTTEVVVEDLGDGQKVDEIAVSVPFRRPRLAQTFKSIVPVAFMLMVASVALFLRPKSINPRFASSTGGLVPLVMFHVGQINSLPPIGYLTMFDKLMVAAYFTFLVHIVFSTMILRSEESKTEERSAKLFKTAAIVVPTCAAVTMTLAIALG